MVINKPTDEQLKDGIMWLLKTMGTGKDFARTRGELRMYLARYLNYRVSDRELRQAYSELPVCTSSVGIYLPINTDDLISFKEYLTKKAVSMFGRYKRVLAAYPALVPSDRQVNIEFKVE